MFYTIYKITNKIDGKIYIGKHQTKDLDDNYMGSGKLISRSIEKYGKDNFIKEILFIFDNEKEMNNKEAELVTEEFVKEDTNYNLCPGGNGGFGYINRSCIKKMHGKSHSEESKNKIRATRELRNLNFHTEETKKSLKENHWSKNNPEEFKRHIKKAGSYEKTNEHRKKLSEATKSQGKQKSIECPHCFKTGGARAMKRWHFDNCKENIAGVVLTVSIADFQSEGTSSNLVTRSDKL